MIRSDMDVYAEDAEVEASAQIGDVIDHGAPNSGQDKIGFGSGAVPRFFNVVVKVAAADSTSQQFILETSDAEGFGTGVVTMATTPVFPIADLVKGKVIEVPITAGGLRYSRVRNVGVADGEAEEDTLEIDAFTTY